MESTERKIRSLKFYIMISTVAFVLITALFIVTTVSFMFAVGKYLSKDKAEPAPVQTVQTPVPVRGGPVTKHDITLSGIVSGNMASTEKYFRFGIEITELDPGDAFTVEYKGDGFYADRVVGNTSSTKEAYRGITQPSRITAGTDGVGKENIYLAHGQTVVIRGVPSTAKYTVTVDPETYAPSVTATEGEINSKKNTVTVNSVTTDNTIVFENVRSGMIPTGLGGSFIFILIFPFLFILRLITLIEVRHTAAGKEKNDEDE